MEKLTEIEMLDKVLEWFAMDLETLKKLQPIQSREFVRSDSSLSDLMKFYPELNNYEFLHWSNLILKKLVKDDYLSCENGLYSITFEGKIFSKQGGYKQAILIQNAESTRVETLASSQHGLAKQLLP
jgi:hypothetical protein